MFQISEDAAKATFHRVQSRQASRRANTIARMREVRDWHLAAGNTDKAEFWSDYLAEIDK